MSNSNYPALLVFGLLATTASAVTEDVSFSRQQLADRFFSEGSAIADLSGDGHPDVIAGPFWFAGPDFKKKQEFRAPLTFNPEGYSDAFIMDAADFDGDGLTDIFVAGWPGREALWFKNPGAKATGDWERHVVFPAVGTESPLLADLVGDGKPELIFATAKKLGWAAPEGKKGGNTLWKFHPVTPEGEWQRYTHGLGIGDVDGDGRRDLLTATGWWQQPASLAGDPIWKFHPVDFGKGGAQMFTYDVNGDGRADIITSIEGHGYGISWFEQLAPNAEGKTDWREHAITSRVAGEKLQGVQFSQPHALALVDIDGDGLLDLVTGKRYWAHGSKGDPEPNAPGVLYWFRLIRENGAARYEPHLIDDASGVGTQFAVADLNRDGRPDIVVSNKQGIFVFQQK